jgi:diguanylate cyclase (GGDEF)-like protein/PAS domain S-box-containing protein
MELHSKALPGADERGRLEALYGYEILDTAPDAAFDRLTELARTLFGVPVALVSLLDENRQWFKSHPGTELCEIPLELSFCTHTASAEAVVVVPDARLDARFCSNPLVSGAPGVRFYAGAPLKSADGYTLGTLCLLDTTPRAPLNPAQVALLAELAACVMDALELHRAARQVAAAQTAQLRAGRELDRFFELSLDLLCIAGTDGTFKRLNPAWEETLGFFRAELTAQPFLDFVHPDDRVATAAAVQRLGSGTALTSFENRYRRRDGRYADLLWTAAPVPDTGEIYAVARDVTARKEGEALLLAEKSFSDAIINSLPAIFYMFNTEGRFVRWNHNLERVTGYTGGEIAHLHPLAFFSAEAQAAITATIETVFSQGSATVEAELVSKEGRVTPYLFTGHRATIAGVDYLIGTGIDVSETHAARAALEHSERRARTILESITDAFFSLDVAGRFTYVNAQAEQVLLHTRAELLGQRIWDVFGEAVGSVFHEQYERACRTQEAVVFEAYYPPLKTWFEVHAYPSAEGLSVYFSDVDARRRTQELIVKANAALEQRVGERTAELERAKAELEAANAQLQHDAFHDSLTGLPNRALFSDRLQHALERRQRHLGTTFAVLFLDCDRFKGVNDSLGHGAGDALLMALAGRLRNCLRPGDTAARLGGDEFVLLLEDLHTLSEATAVAERVQRELTRPFEVGGHELHTSASIGVVLGDLAYARPEEVLRDADLAMYRAKAQGRACYAVFDTAMRERAVAVQALEADLRGALKQGGLSVYYQPIIATETGGVVGFEALVRWQHPTLGAVSPSEFVPLAEETGLVIELDRWVLRQACRQVARWSEAHGRELGVSVNFSSQQFGRGDLVAEVKVALAASGLAAAQLKLELTEGVMIDAAPRVQRTLDELRSLGVALYIDDFGTGYSSLAYLQRFSAHSLKIDRAFIDQMSVSRQSLELVRTIVAMAHNLGMQVVAEGVETPEQLRDLKALNCEFVQGFLFSRPLAVGAASRLLREGPASPAVPLVSGHPH